MGAQQASRPGDGDGILQHFVADLLAALASQLESRSRSMKRPISSVYLLNNCKSFSCCKLANDIVANSPSHLQCHT